MAHEVIHEYRIEKLHLTWPHPQNADPTHQFRRAPGVPANWGDFQKGSAKHPVGEEP
jgi:hypothetical protein